MERRRARPSADVEHGDYVDSQGKVRSTRLRHNRTRKITVAAVLASLLVLLFARSRSHDWAARQTTDAMPCALVLGGFGIVLDGHLFLNPSIKPSGTERVTSWSPSHKATCVFSKSITLSAANRKTVHAAGKRAVCIQTALPHEC